MGGVIMARKLTYQQQMHLWKRDINLQDQRARDYERDAERAELAVEKAEMAAEAIREKAHQDASRAVSEREKFWATEERKLLAAPRTVFRGATVANPDALWVTHARAEMPSPLAHQLGVGGRDTHRLVRLRPGGGVWLGDSAPEVVGKNAPEVARSEYFEAWIEALRPLIQELRTRYSVLTFLRDDAWMASLLGAAGITASTSVDESVQGTYDAYTRKTTIVDVPSLVGVSIERTGLALTFAHRPGTSAAEWRKHLDALRSGFRNAGALADELTVADGSDGSIHLYFNDRDPFDTIPSTITPYDEEQHRSLLGVTSHGHEAYLTWRGNSGLVVGGVPGSGKTASMMPVFAGLAGKAELHIFDGKSGYDMHPLRHIAATYDRTGDIDAPLATLRKLENVRVQRAEALYEKLGANNFWNVDAADRKRLGLTPVFCILDECQTWTDGSGMAKEEKSAAAEVTALVRTLIQKGRSTGIVVILTTQKPDATSIPTKVRDNSGLKLAFRVQTPEAAVTILGKQKPEDPDPTDIRIGQLGRFVMETEGHGVVLGQSAYVPVEDLEEYLAEFEPVPDQAAVAARLLGRDPDEDAHSGSDDDRPVVAAPRRPAPPTGAPDTGEMEQPEPTVTEDGWSV